MSLESNPDARLYYRVSAQRYEDAEVLLNNPSDPQNRRTNGSIYLAGFAVECILKALILANTTAGRRGAVLQDMKDKFGHHLEALRKEAARRGIHMPRDVLAEFRRLNTWDNNNRYDPRIKSTRDAQTLLAAAFTVIRWAERNGGRTDG